MVRLNVGRHRVLRRRTPVSVQRRLAIREIRPPAKRLYDKTATMEA